MTDQDRKNLEFEIGIVDTRLKKFHSMRRELDAKIGMLEDTKAYYERLLAGKEEKEKKTMTVGELKEKLKDIPDNLLVFAEGEEADRVLVEECQGNRYVRIFKSWDMELVLGSAGIKE